MYLKRIEMRGFKSFADKTIVEFKHGVTCVVGPNGSGKSNITDAVRWVLGEQRAKTLRGSKMEDVIFGGTKHRKPLGMAEVKLVFDNQASFLPLEYDEVEIIRRVYRSGESDYSINGMPCRLKDIRELLMDTGIGREGYSIIGQGKIDEILSGGRDERRLLFEEAAGILKFKTRKHEAEKKLTATKDNLSRIEDIISEIEDRVEPLRIESERASKYLVFSEQLRKIELHQFSKRYTTCEETLVQILSEIQNHQDDSASETSKYDQLKAEYDTQDQQLFEINRELRALEAKFHEKQNVKAQTDGERSLIEEKIQNVEHNVTRINGEIAEIMSQKKEAELEVQGIDDAIDEQSQAKQLLSDALTADESQLNTLLEHIKTVKQSNESDLQEIYQKLNEIEVLKREIENYLNANEDLKGKIKGLEEQTLTYEEVLNKNASEAEATAKELETIDAALVQDQSELAETLKHDAFLMQSREKHIKKIDQLTKKVNEAQTELKLLETLEAEYDGYDKGVKEILTSLPNQDGIHGIVATLINVPKKYETAIEVALGRSIQHIVCETDGDAREAIEFLRKNQLGRVTFLPLNQVRGNGQQDEVIKKARAEKGYIGVASDLIDFPEPYKELVEYLLGRIIIVEDFKTAQKLLGIQNIKYKIITLLGDVLIPGGTITGGSFKSKMTNILGRRRRIEELGQAIEKDGAELADSDASLRQTEISLQEAKGALEVLRKRIDAQRMKRVSVEHLGEQHKQMHSIALENVEKSKRNLKTLIEERESQIETIANKRQQMTEAQSVVSTLELNVKDSKDEVEGFEVESLAINARITEKRIEIVAIEQEITFKAREKKRLCDDLETIKAKLKTREHLLGDEMTRKDAFYQRVEDIEGVLVRIQRDLEEIEAMSQEKQAEKQRISETLKILTLSLAESSRALEAHKAANHQLDLKKVKLEVEREAIISELWDKYELTIGEVLGEVTDEPVEGNIKQLKSDLKMLGSVNVNAIKEYEEVSERYIFLKTQQDDLVKASVQLMKIIGDLEKQMVEIFKTYFEKIGNRFRETFKALFHGGDASVILVDEDDILNSDIEIIAQPPGKKLQSLNLLSGGEKALTAIALLFAILETKPTPFCILDEIEAALDDVNVYRFAAFIKAYAEKSQFVIITHRKGTMEVADSLYGVTMEEYGISKVLSVLLTDVQDQYTA